MHNHISTTASTPYFDTMYHNIPIHNMAHLYNNKTKSQMGKSRRTSSRYIGKDNTYIILWDGTKSPVHPQTNKQNKVIQHWLLSLQFCLFLHLTWVSRDFCWNNIGNKKKQNPNKKKRIKTKRGNREWGGENSNNYPNTNGSGERKRERKRETVCCLLGLVEYFNIFSLDNVKNEN